MEFPDGELAPGEPSLGGLTFDAALVRWGRAPRRERLESVFFFEGPGSLNEHDKKLIDQFLSKNIVDAYLLKNLSDKPRNQLLREGLLERWVGNEIRVSGFPLHGQEDRRVWISSALIDELRYRLGRDTVRNFEAENDGDHARGARSYANVRFYLTSMVGTTGAAELTPRAVQSKMPARPRAAEKLPYGAGKAGLQQAIIHYAEDLAAMPRQKDQAKFLAGKVGCSESLAKQVLRDERR
jgi:hypothetical protein